MRPALGYIAVFLGAGIGGALRHGVNVAAFRLLGAGFPYGTLTVNIVGSLAMGLLAGWFALKADPGQSWRLFLTTGILGGFTTFSAFSLEVALLYERRHRRNCPLCSGFGRGVGGGSVPRPVRHPAARVEPVGTLWRSGFGGRAAPPALASLVVSRRRGRWSVTCRVEAGSRIRSKRGRAGPVGARGVAVKAAGILADRALV